MSDIITNNLDIWTSALLSKSSVGRGSNGKQEAYGVKKLRELVLELAVRGTLVPQDPSDEPASVLLERIARAKARLITEGKIRKAKPLPEIADEERDYELPEGWAFVRLGDVAFSQAGFAFKSRFFNESGEGLPLVRIRDVGQVFSRTYYAGEFREEFLVENGDYLISMDGDFRVSPWTNDLALLNQRVSRLIFFDESVGKRFIADSLQARLRELQGVKAYTTVDHLSGAQITESVIGLPPLAEQHRIVTKVEELMALCDQLEQQQTHSIEADQTLVETLLGVLTRAASSQEVTDAWTRIASHFDVLFTTERSIDQLKQTILQLAVMGKLVRQDPSEESASVLLKRIAGEREELSKAGKIKKPKQLPAIREGEMPFELPRGWEYVRLNDLGEWGAGATPLRNRHDYYGGDIPWFKSGELVDDYISESEEHVTELALKEASLRYNKPGDVLIAMYGATIGKTSILKVAATTNQAVCACTPFKGLANVYLLTLLKAFKSRFIGMGAGGAQPNISREKIIETVIPLPPTTEQRRIVAKVDELMALCDALKRRLGDAQTTQIHLADAIVERAVA